MRKCKYCGSDNLYVQCWRCIKWKVPLQEKAGE
jgi:hypothetical protein